MFCSIECRNEAHKYFNEDFEAMVVYTPMVLTGDRILRDFEQAFGGRKKFLKYFTRNDLKTLDKTIFNFDWTNKEFVERYKVVCLLSLYKSALAFLPYIVGDAFKTLRRHETCVKVLDHVFVAINTNAEYIRYFEYNPAQQMCPGVVHDGMMVSLFGTILGDSCMGNVRGVHVENKTVFYTTKPIKAGERLTRSLR
jgi:hypothetical protein